MNRLKSFLFLPVGPGSVVALVPCLLWLHRPWGVGVDLPALRLLGLPLLLLGSWGLLDSFLRFSDEGDGTPLIVDPPRNLVVRGFYRRVRNPMYASQVAILLGETLILQTGEQLAWTLVVWLAFHLFVVGYEEPRLRRTFGESYEVYRAQVPRWLPRLRLLEEAVA